MDSGMIQDHDLHVEKLAHERALSILADPELLRVAAVLGPLVMRRSSVLHGLDAFLARAELRGRHCIEIGTCHGVTAVVLARFFERVTSFDIRPSPLKHEVARLLGVGDRIEFVDVRDNAEKAHLISECDFDAAYVDGDHAHDTATDFALVWHCGRVVFHEYWRQQPPVWDLVNSLPSAQVTVGSPCFALWRDGPRG